MLKIGQSVGFLGRPLGPLLKTVLRLNWFGLLEPLAKSVLIPLGLTVATTTKDDKVIDKKQLLIRQYLNLVSQH